MLPEFAGAEGSLSLSVLGEEGCQEVKSFYRLTLIVVYSDAVSIPSRSGRGTAIRKK